MARMTVQIQVSCTVRHDEQTGTFVSRCPEFDLLSAGNTELEALEAMRSAITLFMQWAYERKALGEILHGLGMKFAPGDQPDMDAGVNVGAGSEQSIPISVPFYLLRESQAHAC